MRVLMCGDRNWEDSFIVACMLDGLQKYHPTIIHGKAPGADTISGDLATFMLLEVKEFPADWKMKGRAAGPIRNQQMLDEGKPDFVIAFHDKLDMSKGTRDMVWKAVLVGIPVYNIRHITDETL